MVIVETTGSIDGESWLVEGNLGQRLPAAVA